MIEKIASRGNILAFRLSGKLSEEDYTDNLIPELERSLERYKTIRLLLRIEYFGGWKEGGVWEEFRNWSLFTRVERMAILADDSWDEWMTWAITIYSVLARMPVRFYRIDRTEEAWDWLEKV
jgi:hypothetical protein